MVDMFEKIGFGQWFRYVTGSLEVTGAVLLLLPRTAALGGWLLAAVMIGAIGTHLFLIGGKLEPGLQRSNPRVDKCASVLCAPTKVALTQAGRRRLAVEVRPPDL